MEKVKEIVERAERQCKEHGSRLTSKRKQVLSALLHSRKALSAYELMAYCKCIFNENIPAMSMYRNLKFLQKEYLVHKLYLTNKYVAFSRTTFDQENEVAQFLICGQCHQVKEINVRKSIIEKLQHNVESAGFRLIGPQLEMNCLCKSCMSGVV